MQAHGFTDPSLLAWQLLTFSDWKDWLCKPDREAIVFAKAIAFADRAAAAALANVSIRADLEAKRPLHTEASIRHNPPVRLRFEEASAIGGLGETNQAIKSKSWGPLVGVFAIEPEMEFDVARIGYLYHAESRYNRRFEQRKYLKKRLRKTAGVGMVGEAMSRSKRDFLKHLESKPDAVRVIRLRLHLDPGQFWRVAKGLEFVEQPTQWVQLDLFADANQ